MTEPGKDQEDVMSKKKPGAASDSNQGIVAFALSAVSAAPDAEATEMVVKVSRGDEERLKELCAILGGSVTFMINAALRYALYTATECGRQVTELSGFPKRDGSRGIAVTLTLDSVQRAREGGLEGRHMSKCAVLGIGLLHERLLARRSK